MMAQTALVVGGVVGDGVEDQVLEIGAHGRGEPEQLALREWVGVEKDAVERLDHLRGGAQAAALGGCERGVERLHGGIMDLEYPLDHGIVDDAGPVPRRDPRGHLVLSHHVGHRLGDRVGTADEGGDGLRAVREFHDLVHRGEAPMPGDQPVEVWRARVVQGPDLDRLAQSVARDGLEELEIGFGVLGGAVAGQGVTVDLVQRDVVDFGLGRLLSVRRGIAVWLTRHKRCERSVSTAISFNFAR